MDLSYEIQLKASSGFIFLWSFRGKKVHKIPSGLKRSNICWMWSNVHPLFLFQKDDIMLHVVYSKSLQGRYDLSRKSGDTQMDPKYVSDKSVSLPTWSFHLLWAHWLFPIQGTKQYPLYVLYLRLLMLLWFLVELLCFASVYMDEDIMEENYKNMKG